MNESPDIEAMKLVAKAVSELNRHRRRAYHAMRKRGVGPFDAYRAACRA